MAVVAEFAPVLDGGVYTNGAQAWVAAQSAATGESVATTGTGAQCEVQIYSGGAYIRRPFLSFDTSSLPDNARVTAARLRLCASAKAEVGVTGSVCVLEGLQPDTSLAVADYDAFGSTELATRVTIASLSTTAGAYNNFTLNASGVALVSKTAHTKFCLRHSKDKDNQSPGEGQYSYVTLSMSETAGTASDPILEVTYELEVGRSWAQPAAIQTTVGRSWDQPYGIGQVRQSWAQPFTVMRFQGGTRAIGSIQVVRQSPGTGSHDSHNAFPTLASVPDPGAPFGKVVMLFRQGTTHATMDGWGTRKQTLNLFDTWTNAAGVAGTGSAAEDQGVVESDDFIPELIDVRSQHMRVDPADDALVVMLYDWEAPNFARCRSLVLKSYDDGMTFSLVGEIHGSDLGYSAPGVFSHIAVGSFIILPSGRYMVFCEGRPNVALDSGDQSTWYYGRWGYSDDGGETWQAGGVIATVAQTTYSGQATSNFEHEAILLDTGRIICVIRVQDWQSGNRCCYYLAYLDPPYSGNFTVVGMILDSVTNRPALLQTVAGDVLLISSGQGSSGYSSGTQQVQLWQSKNRGSSFTAAGAKFGTSGYNGAWLVEATTSDYDGNVLVAWGEEYANQQQADVYATKLTSALDAPPPYPSAPIGRSWDQSYALAGTAGRSWDQPANINSHVDRAGADTLTWTDGESRAVALARTGADTLTWTDGATRIRPPVERTGADTLAWTDGTTAAKSVNAASSLGAAAGITTAGRKTSAISSTVSGHGAQTSSVVKKASSDSTATARGSITASAASARSGASRSTGTGAIVSAGSAGKMSSVSGAGRLTASATTARANTSRVHASGSVTTIGQKSASSTGAVRGFGHLTTTSSKNGAAASVITGKGLVTGTGFASKLSSVTGWGRITGSGVKKSSSASQVRGSGSIITLGVKKVSAASALGALGRVNTGGFKNVSITSQVTGHGRIVGSTSALTSVAGASSVSGAGRITTTTAPTTRSATTSVSASPTVTTTAGKQVSGVSYVTGRGRVSGTSAADSTDLSWPAVIPGGGIHKPHQGGITRHTVGAARATRRTG